MIKIAAYCRVSTDHADQHNSFSSQQSFFREYISRNPDWVLTEIYADEGISGTSTKKRTDFQRMIQDAHLGKFQRILTKEVSRFSRNIVDTLLYTRELKTIGVTVLFLTENLDTGDPKSEMLLSIMATLAQEESRRIGDRVTWGQQRQMEKGVVFGRSLLGYDVIGGKLCIEPEGAALVKLIFQKYTAEQMSIRQITKYLEGEGLRTSTGNPKWRESHIRKILKNEKYAGDLVQRKSYTPDYLTHQKKANHGQVPLITIHNHHEAIVDRSLWEETQKRLQRHNKHNPAHMGHSSQFLFSGKIRCGVCGAVFVSRTRKRKDGTAFRYWCCGTVVQEGKAVCNIGCSLRDEDARGMIQTAIRSLQTDGVAASLSQLVLQSLLEGEGAASLQLHLALQKVRERREKMMDAYFSGEIDKEDLAAMKKRYEKEIQSIQERIHQADIHREEALQRIEGSLESLLHGQKECDIFYKTILDSITVFQDRYLELKLYNLPHIFRFAVS